MTTLRFAYQQPNGIAAIVVAASKRDLELSQGPLSEEAYRQFIVKKSIPTEATNVHEIPDDWVPPDKDRSFRNAWVTDGQALSVDMAKAREIHKDRLRELRAPLLAAADIEMSRAFGDPARQAEIEAYRQRLRDVTLYPGIAAARDPDELRAAVPAIVQP